MSFNYPILTNLELEEQVFLTQLNDPDEKIRFVAVMNIGDEENPDLLPWLRYAVQHDPAALVREEAAKRLESWEDHATLLALSQALSDQDHTVREAASQSLSEIKRPESAQVLADFLQHEDNFVKAAILRAIRPLRPQHLLPDIVQLTQHNHVEIRREAVSTLSWLQHDPSIELLANIAETDSDAEVRRIATGGLAYSKQPVAVVVVKALEQTLGAAYWQLRVEAALTIGKLKIFALQQQLIEALQDPYWQVRIAVVRSLGQIQSHAAIAALAENFNHEISNLRKEVALALGEIGGATAQQLLLQHQQDADPEVRKAIRIALQQVGSISHAH
ncbi:MAG: HEAT repeat domain-containing protein [Acinetobacter sp.]